MGCIAERLIALYRRTIITGTNQLFQSELVKSQCKVFEEVAFVRIVTVAQHHLSCKMLPVVLQLSLYIRHLSIELILLRCFGSVQVLVCHYL